MPKQLYEGPRIYTPTIDKEGLLDKGIVSARFLDKNKPLNHTQ